ncbi:MAG TPA: anthranilate phosphoribosyltransferase [Prolixibacteraceae bacterium]|nr:anthranilate phosphoribosyltransferase [Prolixibacteraceae bacterium]
MKDILNLLYKGNTLDRQIAREIMTQIGQNFYSDIEISSFLTVFLMREITADELAGFRDALLELCYKVDLNGYRTIDVCGTGGDGKNTFNISTISAFVVAGAGTPVAKHGNYGVSGPVGSSNLFDHFGYRFSNDSGKLKNEVEKAGITFMHAPIFHPAMKHVAPVRKALQTKTFFNMLGPMINPASPVYQLVGVYSPEVQNLYADVYRESGTNYMIIHGLDGYDEISLTGPAKIITGAEESIIDPSTFGLEEGRHEELSGGKSTAEAAEILVKVLTNAGSDRQKQVVIANAAAALKVVQPEASWTDCVEKASESLDSGRAYQSFLTLISMQ